VNIPWRPNGLVDPIAGDIARLFFLKMKVGNDNQHRNLPSIDRARMRWNEFPSLSWTTSRRRVGESTVGGSTIHASLNRICESTSSSRAPLPDHPICANLLVQSTGQFWQRKEFSP
jgi:hypothetical protein